MRLALAARSSLCLLSLLSWTACKGEAPREPAPTQTTPLTPSAATAPTAATTAATPEERARAAAQTLKGTVMAELSKAVADKGPAGAIDVCGAAEAKARAALVAPDLAIGRTSSKLRNPANVAPSWVAPILAELESAPKDARGPRQVALADGLGYVEPLVTAPLCLQCHGQAIAPEVQAALAAKYPADKATGYAEGDVRGVVWVEIKRAP